jgi:hypothetical protein
MLRKDTLILRLIEDELSKDRTVKVNDVWTEKNSFNEESDHSYYARVLAANESNYLGVVPGDVVFLSKVYSRQVFNDDDGPYLITGVSSVMAKVIDFDVNQAFRLQINN